MRKGKLMMFCVITCVFTTSLLCPSNTGKGQSKQAYAIPPKVDSLEIKKAELQQQKDIADDNIQNLSDKLDRIEVVSKKLVAESQKKRQEQHATAVVVLSNEPDIYNCDSVKSVAETHEKKGFFKWLFHRKR